MIDTSDGLSTDLAHMCEESDVGAELDAALIPRASVGRPAREVDLDLALHGGEDYELLFTVPTWQTGSLAPRRSRIDSDWQHHSFARDILRIAPQPESASAYRTGDRAKLREHFQQLQPEHPLPPSLLCLYPRARNRTRLKYMSSSRLLLLPAFLLSLAVAARSREEAAASAAGSCEVSVASGDRRIHSQTIRR